MAGRLVGLVGPKRAGKDTVAATLVDGCGWKRVAFADRLRWVAEQTDPWVMHGPYGAERTYPVRLSELLDRHGWEGLKGTVYADETRRLLQHLGVAMRQVDPAIWLRAALLDSDAWRADGRDVVVTDVRFQNEADAIVARGGTLVRVWRPGLLADDVHVSEREQQSIRCHRVVTNDAGLAELDRMARWLDMSIPAV